MLHHMAPLAQRMISDQAAGSEECTRARFPSSIGHQKGHDYMTSAACRHLQIPGDYQGAAKRFDTARWRDQAVPYIGDRRQASPLCSTAALPSCGERTGQADMSLSRCRRTAHCEAAPEPELRAGSQMSPGQLVSAGEGCASLFGAATRLPYEGAGCAVISSIR